MPRRTAATLGLAILLGGMLGTTAAAAIDLSFDYRYDTSGFFAAGSLARNCLDVAAEFYESILDDDLMAIASDSNNQFSLVFDRPDTDVTVTLPNANIPANTVLVFVGAREMTGSTLGSGGPGGWSANYTSSTWLVNARTRGEGTVATVVGDTATDFAPWGGQLAINSLATWHDDPTRLPSSGKNDLLSVLLHELGHVLGIGCSDSWDNWDDGSGAFTGPVSVVEYGSAVPLQSGLAHWASGTMSSIYADGPSQEVAMDPSLTVGSRKLLTNLDVAGLDDLGWDIHPASVWTAAGDGTFVQAANWSTGSVPGARDALQFRLNQAYTVTISASVACDRGLVADGDVTFALSATTCTLDYLMLQGSGASLVVTGGTLRVNRQAWVSGGTALSIGSGGTFDLRGTASGSVSLVSGGCLTGSGCVTGTVTSAGLVSPGLATGTLTLGSFRQLASGTLEIELGGSSQGVLHDLLDVDGLATLGGTLDVVLVDGFEPEANDTFEVLTFTSRSGAFSTITGSLLPDGLVWLPEYGSLSLVLRAAIPGDANLDGLVNDLDASILAAHWQQASGASWASGDFTGDGMVSDLDASILAAHWQQGVAAAVGEPSLLVMLVGATALVRRARGRLRRAVG